MEVDTKHGILKDTINSLSNMGMNYIKCDGESIFFTIDKESGLTRDCDKLKGVKNFLSKQFDYKLMVKFL